MTTIITVRTVVLPIATIMMISITRVILLVSCDCKSVALDFCCAHLLKRDPSFHSIFFIAEVACSGDYENFCKAILKVGLYDRLDDVHEHFTAFFPTDTAFEELLDALGVSDVRNIPTHTLEDIVLLHFNCGQYLYKYDLKHRCSYLLKMTNGDDTRTICKDDSQKLFQKGNGNVDDDRPKIVDFDKESCNGVIHIVDEVILPG